MDIFQKLSILSDGAKYDVSCCSSGARARTQKGLGSKLTGGLCHSWSSDGRCISLLKILLSNDCVYDCAYCVNRRSNDITRSTFTPEEIAQLVVSFYRRNYIEGLFLSSAVRTSPDHTMSELIRTAQILRQTHLFSGYIHLKLIPGASEELVTTAGCWADRVSINVELPTQKSLRLLAPQKDTAAIFTPMRVVSDAITHAQSERKKTRKKGAFTTTGQSTQLIIGATPESDREILSLSEWLYQHMHLKRVYYSGYVPVNDLPILPIRTATPRIREHRLYQADWLVRYYGFRAAELLDEHIPQLDVAVDPKVSWALRHLDQFPVEITTADYHMLLRIPGVGIRSAQKILAARRWSPLSFESLSKLHVSLKRARHFITVNGKFQGERTLTPLSLKSLLSAGHSQSSTDQRAEQLDLFGQPNPTSEDVWSSITGEL